MNENQLANAIIRYASRFIGLREVRPNAEWNNPATRGDDAELSRELREIMRPSPWEPGWAYCAAFCEGVVASALFWLGLSNAHFRAVMSPHVLTSAREFRKLGLLSVDPAPGSIWLAQHGQSNNGHAGIVTASEGGRTKIATIEANTSLDSSNPAKDREGDWITTRIFPVRGRGTLRTLGFVTPSAILSLSRS